MANDYFINIINPLDPAGEPTRARIPHRVYLQYFKFYPVRYENLRATKHVLENPLRIFSGVRAFNEGGWCFTGRPISWYIRPDVVVPFPAELVFCVYLNARLSMYEARADKGATDDPDCPAAWQNRYQELVWKRIS